MPGGYPARPGPTPTLAALVAAGVLGPQDRVLDVGCGSGADAVALAKWGVREVVGIDERRAAIAAATRRARAAKVGHKARFVVGDALALGEAFDPASFTAALDVLFVNNLREEALVRYAQGLAQVVAPGGLYVAHPRVHKWDHERRKGPWTPPKLFRRWFAFAPSLPMVLPEVPARDRDPPYARVALWVGRRNERPA
jgi:SAM-dependent methyltransferase